MTAPSPKEQALLLGPRRALVGVLTPPAEGAPPRDVTMILLNSGIIHRVGANRIHVQLARALAVAGFRVLRFDLSGIGDSLSRPEARASMREAVMDDVREAVDHVAGQHGRVALFGLCSGAADALLYAPRDPRVAGIVMVDLWIPHTRRYHFQRTWNRLTRRRGWVNLMNGRHPLLRAVRHMFARASAPLFIAPTVDEIEPMISEEEGRRLLADAFRPLVARRMPMLAVFTAGLEDQQNYATQLLDAFPDVIFGDDLQLGWFADSNHTFSAEMHRRQLLKLVVDWARRMKVQPTKRSPALASSATTALGLSLSGPVSVSLATLLLETL